MEAFWIIVACTVLVVVAVVVAIIVLARLGNIP
jgi:hypothetical protein